MGALFIPYIVFCEECGYYHKLEEGESVLDFDKCHCGCKLKFAESVEEAEKILNSISNRPKKNFLASKWGKLEYKHKTGIILGIIVILAGIILLIPGFLFSDAKYVAQPTLQQPEQSTAINTPQNVSGIEIHVISNGSWNGSYETLYTNQSSEGYHDVTGTGSKNFEIYGNPSEVLINFHKEYYDGDELTVQLAVNNTIVEEQTVNDTSGYIMIDHFF